MVKLPLAVEPKIWYSKLSIPEVAFTATVPAVTVMFMPAVAYGLMIVALSVPL
jgi:hypothetical protein